MSNNGLISGSFSSDTTLSTPVAINKGGTGQSTAQAALDALAAASGTLVRGDIFTVNSSLNMVRLARGSDNQTMMMAGSDVNWETVAAGGVSTNSLSEQITSSETTISGTFVDIPDLEFDLSNESGGIATIISNNTVCASAGNMNLTFCIGVDGNPITATQVFTQIAEDHSNCIAVTTSHSMPTGGETITLMAKTQSGTTLTFNNAYCFIMASEVY